MPTYKFRAHSCAHGHVCESHGHAHHAHHVCAGMKTDRHALCVYAAAYRYLCRCLTCKLSVCACCVSRRHAGFVTPAGQVMPAVPVEIRKSRDHLASKDVRTLGEQHVYCVDARSCFEFGFVRPLFADVTPQQLAVFAAVAGVCSTHAHMHTRTAPVHGVLCVLAHSARD